MTSRRYVLLLHHVDVFIVGRLHCSRAQLSSPLTGDACHATLGELGLDGKSKVRLVF